jgi:hypothetical protein
LDQNLPCTELVAKRAISLSFPLEKEVKTLCIKISIQPLFRFYSAEIWQEHTSNTQRHHSTYTNPIMGEENTIRSLCPKNTNNSPPP